ncbi:46182_t:CDS:1 [Gigaspora margarita]|uniref:ATP-dependent DNA helicase n=1 Tax=Gigaspora margarita TaxID=4874 RepID=A0ABN7UM25_GIGMA|nr:46182_t:CDS:1 [Gigaspora margarita]
MINAYEEMIADLIHSIPQVDIANLCNIQLLNLYKAPTCFSEFSLLFLLHNQYIVLNKLNSTLGLQSKQKWPYFFITGPAETRKSHILNLIIHQLNTKHIKYLSLASTGLATSNINRQTIHSALLISNSNTLQSLIFQNKEKLK